MRHPLRFTAEQVESSGSQVPIEALPKAESLGEAAKPGFLQMREQLIQEGFGPGDIVFGQDLFNPMISGTYAPYSDALNDIDGFAEQGARPVSELFDGEDEEALQAKVREHVSEVLAASESPTGADDDTAAADRSDDPL